MISIPYSIECVELHLKEVITNDMLNEEISRAVVRSAIRKLKIKKTSKIDGVPGGCPKIASDKIMPFLTKLFNALYDYHYFPEAWSESIIIPIHKKSGVCKTSKIIGTSTFCTPLFLSDSLDLRVNTPQIQGHGD